MTSYCWITMGALIQGLAMAVFLFPHSIPSGGAAGIAVLLNYWFNIPLSVALWIVNFSLLVAAIHWLGNGSALGTMYAITITSLGVHLFSSDTFMLSINTWIDLLLGSIVLGMGIGLLLRENVSNGGMGVIALIVAKYRNTPPGRPLLLLNGSIFLLTASIIDWKIVIQAIVCQWISTKQVDLVYKWHVPALFQPIFLRRKK
ncbi:YitT family protein [Sediminibacillus massiliensis]|uniref:YitT family protein n=1 Tax=Sediminibacillus massiliensis TaxID=1926277 RepID=UPI0031833521